MGDIFDRPDPEPRQETPKAPDMVYTAPDMRDVYKQWRDTGRVPYSYYGAGAPTRDGELEAVKSSYPGAFSQVTAPNAASDQHNASAFDQKQMDAIKVVQDRAKLGNPMFSLFRALGNRRA